MVLTKEMPSLKIISEYLDSLIDILVEFNLLYHLNLLHADNYKLSYVK